MSIGMMKPGPLCLIFLLLGATATHATERWPAARANTWYRKLPWLTGVNYVPSTAINTLEMWQDATFSPARIDVELGWAQSIGMNTVRVFLHDLLWQQDEVKLKSRIAQFLAIADRHQIGTMFVLFDSCWDPEPKLGPQHPPKPGVHNSGWVQSPGAEALRDPAQYPRLEAYVKGVVGAFAMDRRVLAWDVWNEPDNTNAASYGALEPNDKQSLVQALLPRVFSWARAAHPTQPLTSAVWSDDPSPADKLSPIARIQIENSDVVSFHNYQPPQNFERRILELRRYHRPILCTEYMARGTGSTFEGELPIAKKYKVAAINWGLVAGKTQTFLPWDSWQRPYIDRQPAVWFHDIFHADGAPYRAEEVRLIRKLTSDPTPTRRRVFRPVHAGHHRHVGQYRAIQHLG
jgi:Cellulase (glycosyl hydrolase family 5)